jgi:oxygen-independent coproporphyrinogen III oxidase
MTLTSEEIDRHASRATPRYTSYPTAPHFHDGVDHATYHGWLAALPETATLSLYVHVPFCDTLCWFCGCHTKITRQYAPVAAYLDALIEEIGFIGAAAPKSAPVTHIHWGGGSPTILSPEDIRRLSGAIRAAFSVRGDAEFAVEVDPRGMDDARIDALAQSGLTRVSIGVQDFDEKVQAAINRLQSFEETKRVVDAFRARGVASLNIDAMYGLPGQHEAQLGRTLDGVLKLEPDRIALFGYAHVPWMKRHQSRIPEADLPGTVDRYRQSCFAAGRLSRAGYDQIGLDHFARADDSLARAARGNALRRNFQGYTTDDAGALLGLGASAIGRLPQGYVQNEAAIAHYQRQVRAHGSAVTRGVALTDDDRARARVIERLMCDLTFSADELNGAPAAIADAVIARARAVIAADEDGFLEPTADGFVVTPRGRPFVRNIAAQFDGYLNAAQGRHSRTV